MKNTRTYLTGVLFTALIYLLSACNLPLAGNSPSEDQITTSVRETTSALADEREQTAQASDQTEQSPTPFPTIEETPTSTNTPVPTDPPDIPEPTDTPGPTEEPTETPLADNGRLVFGAGDTFATIRGQIDENRTDEYVVNIKQGQVLSVYVESDGRTPALALFEEDGTEKVAASKGFTWYITNVQKTQDYTIHVVTGNFSTEYILHIATPIDVNFDAGATSITYEDELEAGDIIEYSAYALKDQTANITLTSDSGLARLYVYGLSARVEYVGYDDDMTSWVSVLPETQSYLIKVIANGADTEYTLTIEFTN